VRIRSSHGTSMPAKGLTTPGGGEFGMLPPVQLCRLLRLLFLAAFLPPDAAAIKSRFEPVGRSRRRTDDTNECGSYYRRNFECKFHISETMSLVLPQRVLMPGAVR
jgi:hypothetical protein